MSTKVKKTKGKQKIEIKKIENYGDRMITFTKRKNGIHKKLNEIITMCDVEVAFLVFSEAGKPYSFAHPSMEEVAGRLLNEPSPKDDNNQIDPNNNNTGPLVEAYKKRKIDDLTKEYSDLCEQLEVANEKLKNLKESVNEEELNKMWWKKPMEGALNVELMQRHQAFVELYDGLCDLAIQRLGKDGAGSSSGR